MQTEQKVQPPRLPHPLPITEQVWPEGTLPVVSVFCITYNHERFIRKAIEGYLMQETTFPVEIFVHDDASTDGTVGIIKEYATKYPQLFSTVLQTENQYSKAKFAFIYEYLAKQRGEFVALCEGDDYWISPHKLQKQVEMLEGESTASLCFHNALVQQSEDGSLKPMHRKLKKSVFGLDDTLRGWFMPTASIVFRAKQVKVPAVFSFCESGDMCLAVSAALRGKLIYWNEIAGVYLKHPGGVSSYYNTSDRYRFSLMPNWFWMFEVFRWSNADDPVVAEKFVLAGNRFLSSTCEYLAAVSKTFAKNPSTEEIESSLAAIIRSSCPDVMSEKMRSAEYERDLSLRIAGLLPHAFSYAARYQANYHNLVRSWYISIASCRLGLRGAFAAGTEMAINVAFYFFRLFEKGLTRTLEKFTRI